MVETINLWRPVDWQLIQSNLDADEQSSIECGFCVDHRKAKGREQAETEEEGRRRNHSRKKARLLVWVHCGKKLLIRIRSGRIDTLWFDDKRKMMKRKTKKRFEVDKSSKFDGKVRYNLKARGVANRVRVKPSWRSRTSGTSGDRRTGKIVSDERNDEKKLKTTRKKDDGKADVLKLTENQFEDCETIDIGAID